MVVLSMKLGSFWYFSSNFFIQRVKVSVGTTRYSRPLQLFTSMFSVWKLIMKL